MPALSVPDARGERVADRFRLLRTFGERALPTYAADLYDADGGTTLVVVERLTRGGTIADADAADFVRDAQRLAALEHPHLGHVREVVIQANDIWVAWDFIDGERLSSLAGPTLPLDVALRILVDVLSGLNALHNLRGAKREPLKLVHAELTPDNIVVGLDGLARVVHPCRVRDPSQKPTSKEAGYLAPEILLADGAIDARTDVYSVGVLLWEALAGQRLFRNLEASEIVTMLLSGRVPRARILSNAPWAAPLADVAARALSVDPHARFASAAEMSAELRRIAGPRLATAVRVAAYMEETFGAQVSERRARLARGSVEESTPGTGVASSELLDDLYIGESTTCEPPPPSSAFRVAAPARPPLRPTLPDASAFLGIEPTPEALPSQAPPPPPRGPLSVLTARHDLRSLQRFLKSPRVLVAAIVAAALVITLIVAIAAAVFGRKAPPAAAPSPEPPEEQSHWLEEPSAIPSCLRSIV